MKTTTPETVDEDLFQINGAVYAAYIDSILLTGSCGGPNYCILYGERTASIGHSDAFVRSVGASLFNNQTVDYAVVSSVVYLNTMGTGDG